MLVAVISDTHLPRGRRAIPAVCIERMKSAELIIHAGDLTGLAVLEELRSYGEVVAVHGNADDHAVRAALPARLDLELRGSRVGVVHDGGRRVGRIERLRSKFPEADAVIFGHSHLPLLETTTDGLQIFNPGSPTERRRAPTHTMGMVRCSRGRLEFELIALD